MSESLERRAAPRSPPYRASGTRLRFYPTRLARSTRFSLDSPLSCTRRRTQQAAEPLESTAESSESTWEGPAKRRARSFPAASALTMRRRGRRRKPRLVPGTNRARGKQIGAAAALSCRPLARRSSSPSRSPSHLATATSCAHHGLSSRAHQGRPSRQEARLRVGAAQARVGGPSLPRLPRSPSSPR